MNKAVHWPSQVKTYKGLWDYLGSNYCIIIKVIHLMQPVASLCFTKFFTQNKHEHWN